MIKMFPYGYDEQMQTWWGCALGHLLASKGWSKNRLEQSGVIPRRQLNRLYIGVYGPSVVTVKRILDGIGASWEDWAIACEKAQMKTVGHKYYRSDNTTVAMDSTDGFFLFAPVAYPETVKAGDTGTVGKGDEFNRDCTQTFFPKTITGSYAVKADSANSLLVTFISTNNNEPLAGSEAQTATTYRITTSGAITLVLIVTVEKFNSKAFRTLTFTF